ncbi:Cro/CI family transcriptional regulator [Enterococcus casseliflavus]|uniref:helix-turn-helix domain-containing protein n=1 Tax=Enterococcus casseliflavus TaxID=37734 RepID=UPI000E02188B|nr:helix-turn-helix transcriptional regulator [Enterococcus casseliflavus]GEB29707.1 hypothetical protein ECA02_28020 [Enterococcus casseliflavus]STP34837.1 Cro/CI family transcriptional regulator [Enterococcus casseliflavus]
MEKSIQNKLIANRIKELAVENNLSVTKLASEAKIRQSTINNIINNGTMPTVATIFSICEALDISFTEFFDFAPYNKKEALLQASER